VTRFFHPGPNQSQRFGPGVSRRRRERHRVHTQDVVVHRARVDATELQALTWDFWGAEGRILAAEPCDAHTHSDAPSEGALRIVQGCGYDPGNAAYRFHTAVNETTKHASAFVRFGHTNPFCDIRQIDGDTRKQDARGAVYTADVIHAHVDYLLQLKTGFKWRARPEQLSIRHYHGTRWQQPIEKQWPRLNMLEDDIANVVLVGARLTLCEVRPSRMQWLPIAVPVKRYRAMVPKERRPGPFRIAHSPTRADYKGTIPFLEACERLNKRGVKVKPVLIGMREEWVETKKGKTITRERVLENERRTHGKALAMKADCDAVFDSFWLGMQGSGLEGASMGLPVIAGDPDVAALYRQSEVGMVPYTYANDGASLEQTIEQLVMDHAFYEREAKRVAAYTMKYHDYAAVAKRYEGIIAKATGWTNVETKKARKA
jgi:glycosyltransferase involved in cell wall biosynthesis